MKRCNSLFKGLFLAVAIFCNLPHLSALDYYWVGGSGLWSDHNNHWATSSGGAVFHDQVPTSMDNVFFDANSFPAGGTVTIDPTIIYCMDMDWTGAGNMPVFEGPNDKQVWIFGSLRLISDMQWNVQGEVHFRAFQPGKTIISSSKEFLNQVFFDGADGSWTMLDAFRCNYIVRHTDGALFTNGQDVTVSYIFESSGSPTRKLYFGSSNIYIGEGGYSNSFINMGFEPAFFDAGTSTVYMKGLFSCNGCGAYFYGGNQNYYNVVFEAPAEVYYDNNFHEATFLKSANIYGNNHYDNLTFSTGQLYKLAAGSTQTINPGGAFNSNGSCMDFLTIVSMPAGNVAQIEKTTGTVALNYVVLQDIHAIGGATFSAANSADLGNNTGWTFFPVTSRELYWVGGTGDWNDAAHWSQSSGGAGGECIPTPFDNVNFDQNSGFTMSGEQVNINVPVAFCQNMDWTGVLNSPALTGDYQNRLFIFGSLKFVSDMVLTFYGEVHFMAHILGKTITSAGKEFLNQVFFDGTDGSWTMLDAFRCNYIVRHTDGALFTNGQDVTVSYIFESSGSPTRKLYFGSSNIYIGEGGYSNSFINMGFEPAFFDAGTSTVYMKGLFSCNGCGAYFYGGNQNYYNVVFEAPAEVYYDNNFHEATFFDDGNIYGNNVYEILTFSPGSTYELAANSTQTITPLGNFIAEGYGGFPIEIKSTSLGQQATLHKDGDPVCLDFLYLTDIAATGTAFTYAGANSDDVFNNSGWLFEACPGCFTEDPLPAPELDPTSVTTVQPGQQATLIIQNLPAGYEAVWFDAGQAAELYADVANFFQPVLYEGTVLYGALRDLETGCISQLLSVVICVLDITEVITTAESCTGENDGTITVSVNCTTCSSVEYSLDGMNFQPDNFFSGLSAGDYTVIARNTTNPDCFDTAQAIILSEDQIDPEITCNDITIIFNSEPYIVLDPESMAVGMDNCSIASYGTDPSYIACASLGQIIPVTVTVYDASGRSASCISNVSVDGQPCGWMSMPDGIGCTNGSADDYDVSTGTYTLTASGCYTPSLTQDENAYIKFLLCGNGSITAHIAGLTLPGFAGIVMRESEAPGAKKVAMSYQGGSAIARYVRYTTNGQSYPSYINALGARWMRIVRTGNTFRGYYSHNGTSWIYSFAVSVPMNNCIQVGLIAWGTDQNSVVTATFDHVVVDPPYGGLPRIDQIANPGSDSHGLELWPNPSTGQTSLKFHKTWTGEVQIEVRDEFGRQIKTMKADPFEEQTVQLEIQDQTPGIYLVRVHDQTGRMATLRLVLARP